MILKLTKAGSDRASLVNMGNTETTYSQWNGFRKKYETKICYRGNESFVMVEETPQEILKLVHDYECGMYQDTDWRTESIDTHMEKSYDELPKNVFNATDGF
jgi:hypothetical protein